MDLLCRRGYNARFSEVPSGEIVHVFDGGDVLYLYDALGVDGHSSVWLDLESADGIFSVLYAKCAIIPQFDRTLLGRGLLCKGYCIQSKVQRHSLDDN